MVREVQRDTEQVLVDHEDIPGLMPAMTMNFDVVETALLERLEPGQRIEFRLQFDAQGYRILEARVVGTAADMAGWSKAGVLPAEREPAPGFELVDQDGTPVSLAGLGGKVLLLDFVYTHCPGPCPILTALHVQVQRGVPVELRDRVHFVSISLDPERDTPAAMRRYAEAHGADLSHWSFLTGDIAAIDRVLAGYGVGKRPGEDGEIEHIVVTFLIDGEGAIAKRYMGLRHEPADVVQDLQRLAS